MKLIHLSDLHLGKRVHEFSMLEDQEYILNQILHVVDEEKPQGILMAGDIYDKSIPPAEAVRLFDDFLCRLGERELQVFVISGNHDSPDRLAFGSRLMDPGGIHMCPVYRGQVKPYAMEDDYGPVYIYMLPFLKPAQVSPYFPEAAVETYTDALGAVVEQLGIDTEVRNILVTHQFVTGALRSDSEDISVGGADNVDASVFAEFDYVALGHIHRPQNLGSERIRYCGTPLKYSFSEASQDKSVTVLELWEKGSLQVRTVPLIPVRDLRSIRGTYMELTARSAYEGTAVEDYLHITLTDEEDVPDAMGKLRVIYPNLMKLDYDNKRTRAAGCLQTEENVQQKDPLELWTEFYEMQNNQPMSEKQKKLSRELMEKIWRDGV
ncbi:MAG: exonuclease SbcCD subunit D [Acetatifactor sp.]|nr:exonuclease SbcCD subunit D [Acetatifactor sp.]MDE7355033.1 exonuclease SbcCD subunit D [Acetatifactor sp.]